MEKSDYNNDGAYKPYLQDGEKHFITSRESSTSYWDAFYGAFQNRSQDNQLVFAGADTIYEDAPAAFDEVAEPTEFDEVAEPAYEEPAAPAIDDYDGGYEANYYDNKPAVHQAPNDYWGTFYGAFQTRFPDKYAVEYAEEAAPVEEVAYEEPVVAYEEPIIEEPAFEDEIVAVEEVAEEPIAPATPKKVKKTGAILVGFLASAVALAVAVLAYFGIGGFITRFFAGKGTKAVYDLVVSVCSNNAGGMFAHGLAAAYIVAGALTVSAFVVGFIALVSSSKIKGVGALGLISLIAVIAVLVLTYICDNGLSFDKDTILCFLNPHVHGVGAVWGLYIGVAALFIETVCGFASYRK